MTRPPSLSGLMIAGAVGGAPAIINSQTGSQISFRIAENRSASIVVKVFVQETGQAIVADSSVLRIAAGRGLNGSANETPLGGPTTWNNLGTALFDTKADDMTLLPFEADFELTWKGVVAGGAALADGNYTLCLNATDIDAKPAPAAQAGRCDTSVRFTVDRTPPHLTIGFAACPAYDRTFKGGLDIGLLGRDTSPGAQTSPTRPGVLARIFPHRSLGRERENNCWRSISPLPGFVKTCFDRPQNS